MWRAIRESIIRDYGAYLLALVSPAFVLVGVVIQPWFPEQNLLRDPLALAMETDSCCGAHFGLVSNLGIAMWTASATLTTFIGLWLTAQGGFSRLAVFLLFASGFTVVLLLDDLLMLHEFVFPSMGIAEEWIYATYLGGGLAYGALALMTFRWARLGLLVLAGGFLGGSVAVDVFSDDGWWWSAYLLEDGLKLFGIFAWFGFHASICYAAISDRPTAVAWSEEAGS